MDYKTDNDGNKYIECKNRIFQKIKITKDNVLIFKRNKEIMNFSRKDYIFVPYLFHFSYKGFGMYHTRINVYENVSNKIFYIIEFGNLLHNNFFEIIDILSRKSSVNYEREIHIFREKIKNSRKKYIRHLSMLLGLLPMIIYLVLVVSKYIAPSSHFFTGENELFFAIITIIHFIVYYAFIRVLANITQDARDKRIEERIEKLRESNIYREFKID